MDKLSCMERFDQGRISSEEYLIGAVLSSWINDQKDIYPEIKKPIEPRHFTHPWEGEMWKIIIDLREAGLIPDQPTVYSCIERALPKYKDPEVRMWFQVIHMQMMACHSQNINAHVEVIVRHFHDRENNRIEEETQRIPIHKDRREKRLELLKVLDADVSLGRKNHFISKEIAEEMIEDLQERLENRGTEKLQWGYSILDDAVPISRGHFIVLAGRAGMGKTTMMTNLIRMQKNAGMSIGVITLEMRYTEIATWLIAQDSGVPLAKFRKPEDLDDQDFDKLHDAFKDFSDRRIAIQETPAIDVDGIERAIVSMKRDYNDLHTIYIDHIHIMKEASQSNDIRNGITKITSKLKAFSKEHDVAIVALAQMNRDADKRPDKEPQLSDLRESGSIEQDADAIMFMYRASYYEKAKDTFKKNSVEGTSDPSITNLIVRKNRHGDENYHSLPFRVDPLSKRLDEVLPIDC